jgi:hypothetical protein
MPNLQQRFWSAAHDLGPDADQLRTWAEALPDHELAQIAHGKFAVPAPAPNWQTRVVDMPYHASLSLLEIACIRVHLDRKSRARLDS